MSAAGSDQRRGRGIEIMAVVLLAVATMGSAWCAYQASAWNGEEARLGREASEARLEASRVFALATQKITFDTNFIAQYAAAIADDKPELAAFYLDTLARPELRPLLEEWKAEVDAGNSPTPLFENEEYLAEQLAPYQEASALGESLSNESLLAGDTGDQYVLATVVLAIALFFAGMTTSFRVRVVRLMLISGSGITIAYAASRIAELDIV
jgi:hypothetical protein